jgi:glycosyltransferase involved in cell wall biosynthesis
MERRIYFDLSPLAKTAAGSGVYAWELCHRLMRIAQPLQVIPFTLPFRTEGKKGFERALNAALRDSIWNNFLAGMEASTEDYFIFPNVSIPKKFYKQKYALVVLDIGVWHERSYLKWRGQISVQALPENVRNADCIFAISDYTAQDVANEFNIPKDRIIIAPCGLSRIYQCQAPKRIEINGFELPEKYFLHVGSFEPKKNLSFLLQVYERFRETSGNLNRNIKLVLTGGESWKSSEFIKAIKNSPYADDIIILGRVKTEDLPSLYSHATAFVFPSIFEGFGIPVIESLSQGTPVLINANTSLTQFGKFGATVLDNFDVDIWVKELKEILDGKILDPSYIDEIKNYFDWDRTAKIVGTSVGLIN